MNIKRKISLLLILSLGITPILSSINQSTSFAKESKTTIDENIAKKLGVDPSDVEFSNIDIDAVNRILSNNQYMFNDHVGISSESIETTTFTWKELLYMYNIQQDLYDAHVEAITETECEFLISSLVKGGSSWILKQLKKVFGSKVIKIYTIISMPLKLLGISEKRVMTKWLKDGKDLLYKALDTGKSEVTIKYVKLTWKTSGHSMITGGIILK